MADYVDTPFPGSKLLPPKEIPEDACVVVLVGCGSYNPIHKGHVAMLEEAKRQIEVGATSARFGETAKTPFAGGAKKVCVAGGFVSPVNDLYGKAGLAPFKHRLELCQLAFQDNSWIDVDPWEGLQLANQRTFVVLKHIFGKVKERYVQTHGEAGQHVADRMELVFVCGADLFETFYIPGVWELELLKKIFSELLIVAVCRDGSADPREKMESSVPLTHVKSPGVELDMKQFVHRVGIVKMLEGLGSASSTLVRKRIAAGDSVADLVPAACCPLLESGRVYPAPETKKDE